MRWKHNSRKNWNASAYGVTAEDAVDKRDKQQVFRDFCMKLNLGKLFGIDSGPYMIELYRFIAFWFALFITLLQFHGWVE